MGGLAHGPISGTGLSKILLSANTPAPSLSSMQKSANKMRDVLVRANETSMANIRADINEAKSALGLPQNKVIDVQVDCVYNNPIWSGSGKTPYQPGTQVTQFAVENCSPHKHIIGITSKNKLCQVCARKRGGHAKIKKV